MFELSFYQGSPHRKIEERSHFDIVKIWNGTVSRKWRCSMSLLQALRDAGTVETMSASLDALLELMGSSRSGGVHDAAEDARHAVEGYRWLIDRIRGGGQVRDALRGLLQPPPPP